MPDTAANIWGDFVTTGIPSSGKKKPKKSEIRAWGAWIESLLNAIGVNSGAVYTTRALLFANLQPADNSMAWVISDPTSAYNGIYQKLGAVNSGSWTRVGDLPYSFIVASDVGAGTPNAIQATTTIPISESALVWFPVFEANTSSPVTVSFNGETALTIKTNGGNDPVAGGLAAGCVVMGIKAGSTFRLLSDQASSAIQAAAAASAADAANYAALARNDVVVNAFTGDGATTDFTLTVDPGTANNMRVNMGGAAQLHSSYSLVYVSTTPKIRFSEAPPNGVAFEVEMGFRIAVGTPATGSVTYDKIQTVTAALRLLGRDGSGSGQVQELTAAQLRDLFLPAGSVVQSVAATPYATNADITAVIPGDDTIPQIGEGTQILTVNITPTSITSKLRIRFAGTVTSASGVATAIFAIFSGNANAIKAGHVTTEATGHAGQIAAECEYTPGVLTAQTISVRMGTTGVTFRMNGSSAGRLFGGVYAATLVVEEIKA
ncbi:hypothetical protein RLEG12_18660 [Rhizobium leguminosarum bv. trifolii CB782]|nr:hypothetical protein RLEG12_18660 [Rhizobium leguminosarum bv. trifolii CB782]